MCHHVLAALAVACLALAPAALADVDRRADELRIRDTGGGLQAVVVHSHVPSEGGVSESADTVVDVVVDGVSQPGGLIELDLAPAASLCTVCGETCGTFTDDSGRTSDLICVDEGGPECVCRTPRLEAVIPVSATLPGDLDVKLVADPNAAPDPDAGNDARLLRLTNPPGAREFDLDHLIVGNSSVGTGLLSSNNASSSPGLADYLVVNGFGPGGSEGMDIAAGPAASWTAVWQGHLSLPDAALRFTAVGTIDGNPVAPNIVWDEQGPGQFGRLVGQGVGFGTDTFRIEMRRVGELVFSDGPYASDTLPVTIDFSCTDLIAEGGGITCCQGAGCFASLTVTFDQIQSSRECRWNFVPGAAIEVEVQDSIGGTVTETVDQITYIQNLSVGASPAAPLQGVMVLDRIEVRAEGFPAAFFFDERVTPIAPAVPALSLLGGIALAAGLSVLGGRLLRRRR